MSNKTIKLPLHCGKINAYSKRQARALFELKNGAVVTDVEISSVWQQFNELPETGEYVISEPSAYDNDHRVIICKDGVFHYNHGQEIVGVLRRENCKVIVTDGYYLCALHRGSLVCLKYKSYLREYVRKCFDSIKHEVSKHEVELFKIPDEKLDLFLSQILPGYSKLQENDITYTGDVDWHWNDRD